MDLHTTEQIPNFSSVGVVIKGSEKNENILGRLSALSSQ